MTVLTVVAGAVGLQLGESAIAQIDPLYFQGAALPARDVTQDPRRPRPPAYAEASGWAEGYQARAADCGDCPFLLARQSYAPQPGVALFDYSDPTIAPRWEEAEAELLIEEPMEPIVETRIEAGRVQRYLHYPVDAEQTEIRAAFEGPEMVMEAPAPTAF